MDGLVINGLPDAERRSAAEHWNRRWRRIEAGLHAFPEQTRSIRVMVNAQAGECNAHAVLLLPTGTLTGTGRSPADAPVVAVDKAADQLARELHLHKRMLRQEFLYHRRERRRGDLSGIVPSLQDCRARNDRGTFVETLRPALRELRDHARRELIVAQLEGTLSPGEVSVAGLLGELVARVWEEFDRRPPNLAFEHWLTHLLHEMLDRRGAEPATGAVKNILARDDPRFAAEPGTLEQGDQPWPPVETLTLADVVKVAESGSAWERADEEQSAWILSQLREFPRLQRRAFTLRVLEGWSEDEIAMVQHRPPEAVLLDVEGVRDELARKLEVSPPTVAFPANPEK